MGDNEEQSNDFFEIDFLDVESKKSGDAIAIRYRQDGNTTIHVVDGGFQDTGPKVVEHIRTYYGDPKFIRRVVATHPDGDHLGGLRTVLEEFQVGELWMLRPWLYASEIIHRFIHITSVDNLERRLKKIYPNISALEEIALDKNIPIHEPFQGTSIGAFTVLAPSKARYLDLIVQSERTPEAEEAERERARGAAALLLEKVIAMVKAAWGDEAFSAEDTSAENEMSVVQYANLCGKRILLTADAGRTGLTEAADFAQIVDLTLLGLDRFQVPHHGSRRNVSTEILDRWLGQRLYPQPATSPNNFSAIISSAKADDNHPRKAVIRACIHRGGRVYSNEDSSLRTQYNAPARVGWSAVKPLNYPEEQEE